jgi:enterochelin esterase-like enzyme
VRNGSRSAVDIANLAPIQPVAFPLHTLEGEDLAMPDPVRRTMLLAMAGGLTACTAPLWPKPVAPRHGGRFVDYEEFPSQLVAPRHVRVWLPPDYDTSTGTFAVLYMQDGQNVFDPPSPMAKGPWDVDRHLIALREADAVRPTLVVAVWNTEVNRAREYGPQAPIESLPPDLRRIVLPEGGEGTGAPLSDAYVRFLATELKPFIDAHYRTRPDRANTVVMGSSMGGLISLYALSSWPEVFGAAGCLSTHWIITTHYATFAASFAPGGAADPRMDRIAASYRDWLQQHLPAAGTHRLYFDHGTVGLDGLYGPHQQKVDSMMAAKGYRTPIDWMTRVFDGAPHDESAWRGRLAIPLTFLLRA